MISSGPIDQTMTFSEIPSPTGDSDRLTRLPVELVEITGHNILWPGGLHEVYSGSSMKTAPGQKDLSCLSRNCLHDGTSSSQICFRQVCIVSRGYRPNGALMRLVVALKERPDLAKRVELIGIRVIEPVVPVFINWWDEAQLTPSYLEKIYIICFQKKFFYNAIPCVVGPVKLTPSYRDVFLDGVPPLPANSIRQC